MFLELAVNCQLAEDYNEVAMNGNAACRRPLPRRPTSVESDYQDIPAPQPALEELDNSRGMTADTPTVHPEGPYAGINEDEILVEDAEESKDEKGNEWNDIGSPTGRQADKPDGEENMTCKGMGVGELFMRCASRARKEN
nr:hypothetical protein BaRGS_023388 [Batillaria attramentaria]